MSSLFWFIFDFLILFLNNPFFIKVVSARTDLDNCFLFSASIKLASSFDVSFNANNFPIIEFFKIFFFCPAKFFSSFLNIGVIKIFLNSSNLFLSLFFKYRNPYPIKLLNIFCKEYIFVILFLVSEI